MQIKCNFLVVKAILAAAEQMYGIANEFAVFIWFVIFVFMQNDHFVCRRG